MSQSRLVEQRDQLLRYIDRYQSCLVAFSAGVDSSVVAKAAQLVLADQALAVTGNSASLAEGELLQAKEVAELIGIRHEVLETAEFSNPAYTRNDANRCYFCKTELYGLLDQLLDRVGFDVVFSGANQDDLSDYRPGLEAAREHRVCNPLADCGFNKDDVRRLAHHWDLPVWDKPASPCLSSRIAYGEEVTPERLAMIDQAERFLRSEGFTSVRVRYHRGDLARLEVPLEELEKLSQFPLRESLVDRLNAIGFKFVTIDLAGFRSGSLNQLVVLQRGDRS